MTAPRPLPWPAPDTAPYWDAARRHELIAQRCVACAGYVLPPRSNCPHCGAMALDWVRVSGRGVVHTFTVARRPTHPAFADRVPFVIAIVELAEGPRLTTNIVGCPPEAVHIGMAVEVEFEDLDGESATSLPVFRPSSAPSA